MKNFGKLHMVIVTEPAEPETGTPEVKFGVFYDENDVLWRDVYEAEGNQFNWYIAVNGDGIVISAERNPWESQITNADIIGVDSLHGFESRDGSSSVYGKHWNGQAIIERPASGDDVNAERQRRIAAGTVINGVYVTGRDEDARNLQALVTTAQLRLSAGDTTTTTIFRDGNNIDHALTPSQIVELFVGSTSYVSSMYQASWTLKATNPLPQDYANDEYWN